MSEWQGTCGLCEDNHTCAPVLPTMVSQLSSGERIRIMSSATIYNYAKATDQRSRFASGADYIQYKKARVLAGAQPSVGRPLQSAAIAGLTCIGP
jgi:hypothetical protein